MSLNQKYTWKDHLAECAKCNPKKGKKPKRTSREATSCFEKAHQDCVKKVISERQAPKKKAA
ncbi:MAG: hypothetical protein HYY44_02885 [Deltaproteobacteria bacterium]|nr:hypothetical protein [Deltaproteobacteria bacterium]MBI4373710.1 hypothetical protein [Deltaproteobacteria bacterium]